MIVLSDEKRESVSQMIVRDFGNGKLLPGKYIFEQITNLPEGSSASRMSVSKAVSTIADPEVIVLLDAHPDNRTNAQEVANYVGSQDALAFQLSKTELAHVLRFDSCDMYITTLAGRLLIVGCHEDAVVDVERQVWVPLTESS